MESHTSADLLAAYVEKQEAYIVSRIGTQAVAAALEMQTIDITVALKLNEEDFALYSSTLDQHQSAKHKADPTEEYLEAWQEFNYSVITTFGELNGYGLGGVDDYGLTLTRIDHSDEKSSSLVRLNAQVVGTDITMTKVQQFIDADDRTPLPMRIGPMDRMTVNIAFERLRKIVEAI